MKILLVNEYNTDESFDLTEIEARQLLEIDAVFVCLKDTEHLSDEGPVSGIALHPSQDDPDAFAQYVGIILEYRALKAVAVEDTDPFTGKIMHIIAPPKQGPEAN